MIMGNDMKKLYQNIENLAEYTINNNTNVNKDIIDSCELNEI